MVLRQYAAPVAGDCGRIVVNPFYLKRITIENFDKDIRNHLKYFVVEFADLTVKPGKHFC